MSGSQGSRPAVPSATRRVLQRHATTLLASRAHLAGAVLAIGVLGVHLPLSSRLDSARVQRTEARQLVERLREVEDLMSQAAIYHERLAAPADLSVWQGLLHDQLALAGCRLLEFTPNATLSSGNFEVLDFSLRASGSYAQLVDFVDRLERSEHLIRIDDLGLAIESRRHVLSAKIRFLTGFSVLDQLEGGEVQP